MEHEAGGADVLGLAARLAALVIAAATAIACVVPKRPTPVDLVATAESVSLRLADEAVQLPPVLAETISIVGSGRLEGLSRPAAYNSIVTVERAGQAPPLTLQGLRLSGGALLALRKYPGLERTYEIEVVDKGAPPGPLTVFVQGAAAVTSGAERQAIDAQRPTPLRFTPAPGERVLVRVKLAEPEWAIRKTLAIRKVDFAELDPRGDTPDEFSTLASGTMRLVDIEMLDGSTRKFEFLPGQIVDLGDIERGVVRQLAMRGDRIDVGLSGEVGRIETRWRDVTRNHLPSWFAYLSSNDLARSIFAGLTALCSLIAAGWRVAGRKQEKRR